MAESLSPLTQHTSSSSSSLISQSQISRQSSTRSTSSVVAVPFRTPLKGPKNGISSHAIGGLDGYFAGVPINDRNGSMADSSTITGMSQKSNSLGIESRPNTARASSSTLSAQPATRPANSRQGSNGSIIVVRKTVGDFTFGEVLGEGSYSTVTLVTDKHPPNKSYALKVLNKEHIKREKKTKYVLIERDTLKALDGHPGIVRLYWTFQDAHSLYYVLELAVNGELLKWIKKFGSFSLPSATYYAAQVLSAVEYMHSKGVIHRDLKPENILLDQFMRVKITDFGTAKVLSNGAATEADQEVKRARSFVGTPEYVSPEILSEKKESSKSSDYWGFGCILFQIIAGRPPFQARTEYLMFRKIISLEYEFPSNFPAEARDLIEKLLVLDPNERLGGNEQGITAIKSHPFFSLIDFSTIWTIDPPPIETGITEPVKEIKGEFVLNDFSDDGVSENGQDVWANGVSEDDTTPVAADFQGVITTPTEPITKWSGVLLPTETILLTSPIVDRTAFLSKKRTLLLTDFPRLICIKESPTRVTLKSEVFIGTNPTGSGSMPTFVKAESNGEKVFTIKSRTYKYEAPEAKRWVAEMAAQIEQRK